MTARPPHPLSLSLSRDRTHQKYALKVMTDKDGLADQEVNVLMAAKKLKCNR